MTSTRKPGSPTCWRASPITRSTISPRCCHGIGNTPPPDRARRLTRPARLIGAHLQLGGKIEKSSLWPRWSSLPAVRRDDSCLERNRAPRGPQRMLTMQSTRHAFRQHVVPHPPGAIGSIAGEKAGANLRAQLLIAPAALTARPCQPGIEPTPRDTERPAQPFRWPDPPVLRNETELHVDSFAK